jgi:heme ABC exporter ATP-binding subunit CcmA
MASVINLRDVVAVLGGFPALAGVNLGVDTGELVALAGPNGAGKTTVLRVCAGLVPVVSGEATVLGYDLFNQARRVRSRVGLLGPSGGLYDDLTVHDNLRFFGRASGVDAADTDAAADRFGLVGRLASTRVSQLSTGQRRRVALAALVARRAELWLMDEPHAGLDAAGRDLLDEVMLAACAAGATVMLASHDLDRTAALGCRHVHLAGGTANAITDPGGGPGEGPGDGLRDGPSGRPLGGPAPEVTDAP